MKHIFVLKCGDKNVCHALTHGEVREAILTFPDDKAELLCVERLYSFGAHMPARDATMDVAQTWAMEFEFSDGISPDEYLSPFPAFVRAHYGDVLIAKFEAPYKKLMGA